MRKNSYFIFFCVLEMNMLDCVSYISCVNFFIRDLGYLYREIMKKESMVFFFEMLYEKIC